MCLRVLWVDYSWHPDKIGHFTNTSAEIKWNIEREKDDVAEYVFFQKSLLQSLWWYCYGLAFLRHCQHLCGPDCIQIGRPGVCDLSEFGSGGDWILDSLSQAGKASNYSQYSIQLNQINHFKVVAEKTIKSESNMCSAHKLFSFHGYDITMFICNKYSMFNILHQIIQMHTQFSPIDCLYSI